MQLTGKQSKNGTFVVKVVTATMCNEEQTSYQEYQVRCDWESPIIIEPIYDYSKTEHGRIFGTGPVDLDEDLLHFVISRVNTDYKDKHKLLEYHEEAQEFVDELNTLIGKTTA